MTSITEKTITIENALKIWMLNNLGREFKAYLAILNDRMKNDEERKDNKKLSKAIEEEETRIVAEQKPSVHFVTRKSHYSQSQKRDKKDQIEWLLYWKCACQNSSDQVYRYTEDECYRCHK